MKVRTEFKVPRVRSKAHLRYVRQQPCCVPSCGRTGFTVAHHLTIAEAKARGLRAGDNCAIPLCVEHHDAGHPGSVHHRGDERAWWAEVAPGFDPLLFAQMLWESSGSEEP